MSDAQAQALPVGNQQQQEQVTDLSKIIESSKLEILESQSQPTPIKRGRGRPRKTPKIEPAQQGPAQNDAQNTVGMSQAPQLPIAPYLAVALKVPFGIAAAKTDFEGFELTDEEAKDPAQALETIINLYFPDLINMDPKKLAILAFAVSIGSLSLVKYNAYLEFKKAQKQNQFEFSPTPEQLNNDNKPAENPVNNAKNESMSSGPPAKEQKASEFFNKKAV